jgi:hypothetical protein
VLRAETTKNGKADVIGLHPALVRGLTVLASGQTRQAVAEHKPTNLVFPKLPTMEQMRLDLCEARIPFVDEQGRRADFHALRHTLCTNLQRGGHNQRVVIELMRHSDRRLTDKIYTDSQRLDTYAAIAGLKGHGTQAGDDAGTHVGTQTARPGGNHLTQPDTGSAYTVTTLVTGNQAVDPMGIKLTQLEPKREMVRGTGFEPADQPLPLQSVASPGTQGGTQMLSDPDLAKIVTAWPALSEERRKAILSLAELP